MTCLKWLPKSENLFLASHASGHLYLYNVEHPCGTTAPQYCLLRQGEGFAVYACKSKTPRNPLLRWVVGEGGLNEFAFSPDGVHVACVGQDGCLRVFPLRLDGASRRDEELLRRASLRVLEPRWEVSRNGRRRRFSDGLVVRRESRRRARTRPQVVGQRRRVRPVHDETGGRGADGAQRQRGGFPAGGAAVRPRANQQHAFATFRGTAPKAELRP